jgi:hypothetical protein
MSVADYFTKKAKVLVLATVTAVGGVGCGGSSNVRSSEPLLYETNAIPANALPQACRDYQDVRDKAPDWESIVESGVIGVSAGRAAQIFGGLGEKETEAVGGAAALADIMLARQKRNQALSSLKRACNVETDVILKGQLCTTKSSEDASTGTYNGGAGTYEGNISVSRNCVGVQQVGRPGGLTPRGQ